MDGTPGGVGADVRGGVQRRADEEFERQASMAGVTVEQFTVLQEMDQLQQLEAQERLEARKREFAEMRASRRARWRRGWNGPRRGPRGLHRTTEAPPARPRLRHIRQGVCAGAGQS